MIRSSAKSCKVGFRDGPSGVSMNSIHDTFKDDSSGTPRAWSVFATRTCILEFEGPFLGSEYSSRGDKSYLIGISREILGVSTELEESLNAPGCRDCQN